MNITIDPALLSALKKLAKENNRSVSNQIEKMIMDIIQKQDPE